METDVIFQMWSVATIGLGLTTQLYYAVMLVLWAIDNMLGAVIKASKPQ